VPISAAVSCKGGVFKDFPWNPAQVTGCTKNTPIGVIAIDIKTLNPAAQEVLLLCEAAVCPKTLRVVPGSPYTLTNASMANYFESGSGLGFGSVGAGPSHLQTALNDSNCTPDFVYERTDYGYAGNGYIDGSSTPGSFTKCTYKIKGIVKKSDLCWKTDYDETLVFTCPNSGGC
jgi:hypothetical protein